MINRSRKGNCMEIKVRPALTVEELEKLKKEREVVDNAAKKKEMSRIVRGNLQAKVDAAKAKTDRFHLPVLHINDPTQWPSQPNENRPRFTDEVAYNTCLGNCCGVEGLKAGCCQMDPDDMEHVLGPLDEEWIEDIVKWLRRKGIAASRADVVIDWEEGKIIGEKFFNGERKAVFLAKESYPILRFQVFGPRFACKFLNPTNGKCTIYEKRPKMCRGYLCQYVKANFLIRTDPVNHPHTYTKFR
jgi:Fe-S-cluster containining protein